MRHDEQDLETATFAGGCFWCTESEFAQHSGITQVVPGYTGGHTEDPTYEQVCSGRTGHVEAVQVKFDPARISYEQLLEIFWKHVDPTDPGGQFVDRGSQYQSAIFYHNERQKDLAESTKHTLANSGRFTKPLVTPIAPLKKFYLAEPYHHAYSQKNPLRYQFYRNHSGRDQFLQQVWQHEKQGEWPAAPIPAKLSQTHSK